MRDFLRLEAVLAKTALSKSEWYRRVAAGTAPRAIVLGPRTKAWDSIEIEAWLEATLATAPREEL
jgi:prophage regulatory protein